MIETIELTKEFSGVLATDGVSFRAEPGQVTGFLGPNGAGKSTTLRILACTLAASSGSARVAGYDVASESLAVRANLGYLPETTPLYEDMRVDEFLHFRGRMKGLRARAERARTVAELCERCWIGDVRRRIIGQLSKGYRQRVGLAEALLADPPVVILDEPTVGLDPHQVRQVRRIIRELGETKTVLFSTHILSEVEELCDRVIMISRGRIVADGSREEIVETLGQRRSYRLEVEGPRDEVARAVAAHDQVVAADIRSFQADSVNLCVWSTVSSEDLQAGLTALLAGKGWSLRRFESESPDLEDLFVHLTAGEARAR